MLNVPPLGLRCLPVDPSASWWDDSAEGIGRMRIVGPVAALALLITGCGRGDEAGDDAPAVGSQVQSESRMEG